VRGGMDPKAFRELERMVIDSIPVGEGVPLHALVRAVVADGSRYEAGDVKAAVLSLKSSGVALLDDDGTVRKVAGEPRTLESVKPRPDYVPRNRRPERKAAIAALIRYLDASPDLRIGQAVIGLFADRHDAFNAEDADLIAAVERRL
jgi:hypothetical protein